MAIESGVDEVDIDELGIEDNSKEIVIGEASFSDEIIDSMGDEDIQTLDDGTMVFGMDDQANPISILLRISIRIWLKYWTIRIWARSSVIAWVMFRTISPPEKSGWTNTKRVLISSA
jgi:hypothetical protein